MHLYLSGTPKNDRFQVIENQMCSHRLFSLYRAYQSEVFSWLANLKAGIRTFADYCSQDKNRIDFCASTDRRVERMLIERGIKDEWPGYHAALTAICERHQPTVPKHIMLDSGAFTA
ncbi:MAG: hypothetical protein JXR15_13290 [Shimia sp.]|uniref:hypothetical protein n=1 Tax=Shimia sp. TaxID=1954381 RepID=UPI003B8D5B6B